MKTSFLRQLRLLVFFPCYAGNGGYASLSIEVQKWWTPLKRAIEADPRIEGVGELYLADTPITMTRNQAVKAARDGGYDLLMMVDSDMLPDCEIGHDENAKPFWETAFEFAYERMRQHKPTVIFAPYGGGGDCENSFVFKWQELANGFGEQSAQLRQRNGLTLEQYDRDHAATLTGIVPMAAGPTGLILYTIDAFECWASSEEGQPFFKYEMTPDGTQKLSTEDVYNTRSHSLGGWELLQEDIVFCACDSWAGHIKNRVVRKPVSVGNALASAKILAYLENEQEAKRARLRAHYEKLGIVFDVAPQGVPEADSLEAPASVRADFAYPFADERLSVSTLVDIERLVERVLDARQRRKGDILVAHDRDLAVTRVVTDALLRRKNVTGDDIKVYYTYGDNRTPAELDACRANGPELDKQFDQTGLVRKISQDIAAEGVTWDDEPMHLVVDLRTKPYHEPIAQHAYAYLSLVEPLGWRHDPTIHYRQDRAVRSVWFGINEDMVVPEDAPHERAEPVSA